MEPLKEKATGTVGRVQWQRTLSLDTVQLRSPRKAAPNLSCGWWRACSTAPSRTHRSGNIHARIVSIGRAVDTRVTRSAYGITDSGQPWIPKTILKLRDATIFADGCPLEPSYLPPCRREKESLSAKAGGVGPTSATDRRLTSAISSTCKALPVVLLILTWPSGRIFGQNLPTTALVYGLGHAPHERVDFEIRAEGLRAVPRLR